MKLILGDCIDAMRELDAESVDAVVTDPPYGINFMGKAWDGKAIEEAAQRDREYRPPGSMRLTGSPDSPHARRSIRRTASGFGNAAGNAGSYDFTLGQYGDERDWSEIGGPISKDHTKQRERSGSMHAGEYDQTPRGMRGFQTWTEMWAREAFRVLKPGGHLLSFSSPRTYHRMTCGIEEAGFEIRDCIAWMYGSGFPKSLDVSKAVDGLDAPVASQATALEFTAWLRSTGITAQQINEATNSVMASHYLTDKTQPAIPTAEMWALIRPLIAEVPPEIDEMIGYRSVSENLARREVIGETETAELIYAPGTGAQPERRTVPITLPHTPEARDWHGWGTALKPAFEPIVVARKPLAGTVGRNVLRYGTGALNIDGCRLDTQAESFEDTREVKTNDVYGKFNPADYDGTKGRWPANVVLDEQAAAVLDEQSGELQPGASPAKLSLGTARVYGDANRAGVEKDREQLDGGGASRFFYCAKVSAAERNAGLDGFEAQPVFAGRHVDNPICQRCGNPKIAKLDGPRCECEDPDFVVNDRAKRNIHPTVKPIALMRWLLRLVTPAGGVVLDPFLGSGSTGCAAMLEGFGFVGVEREPDYLPIATARIAFWAEHGEDGLRIVAMRERAEAQRAELAAMGQLDLFAYAGEGDA